MIRPVYVIAGVVITGALVWWYLRRGEAREGYGAMKNAQKIPFNDCARMCKQYRDHCVRDFIDADPSWCDRREEACQNECYYAPIMQLSG